VTAKGQGGNANAKRQWLVQQMAGKKRMRQLGRADIPDEAFVIALKMDG
jgi:GTP-binding protein LepA